MSTFKQLIDMVDLALSGFVLDTSRRTHITSAVAPDDLTMTVEDASVVSRGLVEVDEELVWVSSVDQNTGIITIPPYGRGFRSTTAVAHDSGVPVVDNPIYPRAQIRRYINEVLSNMYPDVYALRSTTFAMVGARSTYELPGEAVGINSITWQTIGPSLDWQPVQRWEFDGRADTTAWPTGRTVDIWSLVIPGRTVKVDYLARPGLLTDDDDDFEDVTGLRDYCETAVVHGACYRLAGLLDIARLQTRSVESSTRSQLVGPGDAAAVGKYFYALYTEALASCRDAFLKEVPSVLHFRSW